MREILFKAKRKDNGKWVEGYYFVSTFGNHFVLKTGAIPLDFPPHEVEVDKKTVCQYTGWKDKQGQKIFEKDLILREFDKLIVLWNEQQGKFDLYTKNNSCIYGGNQDTMKLCEVAGNIYDLEDIVIKIEMENKQ